MKIFISFATADRSKCQAFSGALKRAQPPFSPIVVSERREPGRPLADKVREGITDADYVVPILTHSSYLAQWVNQEIGFAIGLNKPVVPLVCRDIVPDLKGFINDQTDLSFSYSPNKQNPKREAGSFRAEYRRLIDFLQSQRNKALSSTISPHRVKSGAPYTTRVTFKGTVVNGFFDNRVVHLDSDFRAWNWDPETLRHRSDVPLAIIPGELNGAVEITRTYVHFTKGWPTGRYRIFVRLYSHLEAGKEGRTIVAENEHDFEVY